MATWDDILSQAYTAWRQPLLRWLHRRVGNAADAEDLVQEAYTRWAESPASTRPESPRSYLARIVLNAEQEPRFRRLRQERDTFSPQDAAVDIASEGTCPFARAASHQALDRLTDAIAELPPRQRYAFMRHRFDNKSYDEIAAEMGISRRMVAKHIANAVAYCQLRIQFPDATRLAARLDRA
jgi:RNA polymerase sigma-70 factor (ECF subfamily)